MLKTVNWNDESLAFDPIHSVGGNFKFGGYGKIKKPQALGHGGLLIAEPRHKLFAGLDLREKQFLPIYWSREYDGAPVVGLDASGIPIADRGRLDCHEFQLLTYEWAFRAGHTFGTTHLFRRTPTSGFVLHLGAKDTCQNFPKPRPAYQFTTTVVKTLIGRVLNCAMEGTSPFDDAISERELAIPFCTPLKGRPSKVIRRLAALTKADFHPPLFRKKYLR